MEVYDGLPRHIRDALKEIWCHPLEVIELLHPGRSTDIQIHRLRMDDIRYHRRMFGVTLAPKTTRTRTGECYFPTINDEYLRWD